jgi:phosphomannomutase
MDLALAHARRSGADLVLANDPDADRLAVAVPVPGGDWRLLSGNEIGFLLAHYLLTENVPPGRPMVATTIVSSGLMQAMAKARDAEYAEVLTGFKWIADRAMTREREAGVRFLFGYEEALGYTVGDLVRDKDGVSAALLFAELASWCRERGQTVPDLLDEIFRRYGLFASRQKSLTLPGMEGMARIAGMMDRLRAAPPSAIGGSKVIRVADLREGMERDLETGRTAPVGLPASNVLRFRLADGSRILARPSGTEPKIKFYFEVTESVGEGGVTEAYLQAERRLERLEAEFLHIAGA